MEAQIQDDELLIIDGASYSWREIIKNSTHIATGKPMITIRKGFLLPIKPKFHHYVLLYLKIINRDCKKLGSYISNKSKL